MTATTAITEGRGAAASTAPDHVGHPTPSPNVPGRVQVRVYARSDRDVLLDVLERHHQRTPFHDLPFSRAKVAARMDRVDAGGRDRELGLTALLDGVPVGVAHATLGPYLMSEAGLIASAQAVIVDPAISRFAAAKAFVRLLRGIEAWAGARGAAHTMVHNTAGLHRGSDRLLRRWGAAPIGANYVKGVGG